MFEAGSTAFTEGYAAYTSDYTYTRWFAHFCAVTDLQMFLFDGWEGGPLRLPGTILTEMMVKLVLLAEPGSISDLQYMHHAEHVGAEHPGSVEDDQNLYHYSGTFQTVLC